MNGNASLTDRESLEHQRSRIEELLEQRVVSPEMARQLRRRLVYVSERLNELHVPSSVERPDATPAP